MLASSMLEMLVGVLRKNIGTNPYRVGAPCFYVCVTETFAYE